jgi:hypothetical protein
LVSGATSGTHGTAIYVVGHVYGVVDNNNLAYYWAFTTTLGGGNGISTWQNFTFDYGTANNIYLEDNVLTTANGGHSCAVGGRYCSRYNTYNANDGVFPLFDIHGNQPPGQWAPAGAELYGNTLIITGNYGARIFDARGGKVLAYNNNIITTDGVVQQIREEHNDSLQNPSTNLISGQPMYPSDCYFWNNTKNGITIISTTVGSTIDYGGEVGIVPRANYNFWDYNASFDGTSGVGVGLLSSRPTTCTTGVGYWANDTKTLYKCNATNTWIAYYTPYTYPHPFRTDCINYPEMCDSGAATITIGPDNCSAAAVNAAISGASEGDTIQLTCTGTVTWDSQVLLSGGKTLKGPGIKSPDPSMNGTWPLVINSTASGIIIDITNAANQEVNRVTGFRFIGGSGATFGIASTGAGTGKDGNGAFRIDNNYFDAVDVDSRLLWLDGDEGKLTGLVDHNVLYHTYTNGYAEVFVGQDWKGASPTCYGYDSRTRPFVFGGSDFIFFEDNYFFNGFIETSGGGGRYVVRYNIFDTSSTHNDFLGVDGHGSDTGGWHCVGVVGVEMYNNNITGVGTVSYSQVADARGGKWMIYNNNAQSGRIQLQEYRALGLENYPTGGSCMSLDFNECDGAACCEAPCGTYNMQCPTDQDIDKCWPLPNQVSNTFLWNNLKNGNYMPPSVVQTGYVKNYIVKNRDYWEPAYGLESALPPTCTADGNTFYGTTDSGKLFKCTSDNIWTLQYTPYPYPHPLAGGSPPQHVPGDIDGDGDVDINDLSFIGIHFGRTNTHPQWNLAADLVANNEIDIYDVVFVASRFS